MPKPTSLAFPIALCGGLALAGPLAAQQARFDVPALERACLSGGCLEATRLAAGRALAQGLAQDALNSQIGVIAAVLFDTARQAGPELFPDIASALAFLADLTSDGAQRESLLLLARQVAAGEIGLFDLQLPFAASPA